MTEPTGCYSAGLGIRSPLLTLTYLLCVSIVVGRNSVALGSFVSRPPPAAFATTTRVGAVLHRDQKHQHTPSSTVVPLRRRLLPSLRSTETSSSEDDHHAQSKLPPVPTDWKPQVLSALSTVIDPDLNADIVSLGFVQNLVLDKRDVSFDVELTTPACPIKDLFESQCRDLILDLPWTTSCTVKMTSQPSHMETSTSGMANVGAIIAVSSCKGGVGKSTTAVNLAYALRKLGATVGIFDADVYGPSLPTMVTPNDDAVRFLGRQIAPLERDGVKLMSFGYVNEGSAIMRGPMVTQLLDQFLSLTQWGNVDYLILDMPPGTGDIQLTLSQRLNITAAVIVTTPQELSFADVVRGIDMFDSVNVPCVAVVENMAYIETDTTKGGGGEKVVPEVDWSDLRESFVGKLYEEGVASGRVVEEVADELIKLVQQSQESTKDSEKESSESEETEKVRIFGPGHKRRLSEQFGIEHTYSIPLLDRIAANGDSGIPFVLEHPDSSQAKTYGELAGSVAREVAKTKFASDKSRLTITYDESRHSLVVDGTDELSPAELRRECRCAACVEELSGRQILVKASIPESVKPRRMEPCGNYALSVDWSDGHKSLYPYRQIRSLLGEGEVGKEGVEEGTKTEKEAKKEEVTTR